MSRHETRELLEQARRIAELIARAHSARIEFDSEQQFLCLLGLEPQPVPLARESRYPGPVRSVR